MTAKERSSADFILDCSITMAWCFEDEITEFSERVFNSLTNSIALVPALWALEVANVLLIAERKKRLNKITSAAFKDSLHMLPIQIDHTTAYRAMGSIMEIASETGITIYDATYLELALHTSLPLATFDKDLKKAAEAVGIKLFQ